MYPIKIIGFKTGQSAIPAIKALRAEATPEPEMPVKTIGSLRWAKMEVFDRVLAGESVIVYGESANSERVLVSTGWLTEPVDPESWPAIQIAADKVEDLDREIAFGRAALDPEHDATILWLAALIIRSQS